MLNGWGNAIERYDPWLRVHVIMQTWASTTHRQYSLQAVAVATVNATFDWVASESKRVLREVLQVREKERRLEVTPPVACARPIEAAARDDGDKDKAKLTGP